MLTPMFVIVSRWNKLKDCTKINFGVLVILPLLKNKGGFLTCTLTYFHVTSITKSDPLLVVYNTQRKHISSIPLIKGICARISIENISLEKTNEVFHVILGINHIKNQVYCDVLLYLTSSDLLDLF